MQKILFDSRDLPGDERLRKERWVDSLSSGYARLHADAAPETPFEGALKIIQLGHTSIGSISGTVRTISRTAEDIAVEDTDNVVLLFNSGTHTMCVEQKARSVDCVVGGAVLIEQREPSVIKMAAQIACGMVAIQVPRRYALRENSDIENRFLTPASVTALALARVYVDTLLSHAGVHGFATAPFAGHHITDLVAAAVGADNTDHEARSPKLRAARFEAIRRHLDRNFLEPDFSLTALAHRLGVTPRYVQVLFAEAATSFTDEVTRRRLTRAYEMLASPRYAHLTAMDVAHECGFATVSHFHRIFRRHFDATPGDVRRNAGR